MRKVIDEQLDDPLEEVFKEFEQEPIAAASIGQVYRATLHDRAPGRRRRDQPGADHGLKR